MTSLLACGLIAAAAAGGARPGRPLVPGLVGVAWLGGMVLGVGAALGLIASLLLEVFDRLPRPIQQRLRATVEAQYFRVGSVRGVPVRVHFWFFLLLLPALRDWRTAGEAAAANVIIILVHEWGHAFVARRYRCRVTSIDLSPLGGVCRFEGDLAAVQLAWVAWGGVLAQGALQLGVSAGTWTLASLGAPRLPWLGVFTLLNVSIAITNLLPIAPLDGATAWTLPGLLWRRFRGGAARGARPKTRRAPATQPRARRANGDPHLRLVQDALEEAKRDALQRLKVPDGDDRDRND